jgi:hypothetical protein
LRSAPRRRSSPAAVRASDLSIGPDQRLKQDIGQAKTAGLCDFAGARVQKEGREGALAVTFAEASLSFGPRSTQHLGNERRFEVLRSASEARLALVGGGGGGIGRLTLQKG